MVGCRSNRLNQNKPLSGPVSTLMSSSAEFYSFSLSGRLRAIGETAREVPLKEVGSRQDLDPLSCWQENFSANYIIALSRWSCKTSGKGNTKSLGLLH